MPNNNSKPSITDVLEHYGAPPLPDSGAGWQKTYCPVHDEQVPSASYNSQANYIHCFACGFSGDSWSLIMEKENIDFSSAKQFAEETLQFSLPESTPEPHGRQQPLRVSILDRGTRTNRSDTKKVHARSRPRRRPRLR